MIFFYRFFCGRVFLQEEATVLFLLFHRFRYRLRLVRYRLRLVQPVRQELLLLHRGKRHSDADVLHTHDDNDGRAKTADVIIIMVSAIFIGAAAMGKEQAMLNARRDKARNKIIYVSISNSPSIYSCTYSSNSSSDSALLGSIRSSSLPRL